MLSEHMRRMFAELENQGAAAHAAGDNEGEVAVITRMLALYIECGAPLRIVGERNGNPLFRGVGDSESWLAEAFGPERARNASTNGRRTKNPKNRP